MSVWRASNQEDRSTRQFYFVWFRTILLMSLLTFASLPTFQENLHRSNAVQLHIRDLLYQTASLYGTHYQRQQPPQSRLKPSRPVHQVSWYIYIRPEHNFSSQPTAQQLSWLCTLHSTTHTLWRWRADLTTHPDVYDGRRTWTYTCTSGL